MSENHIAHCLSIWIFCFGFYEVLGVSLTTNSHKASQGFKSQLPEVGPQPTDIFGGAFNFFPGGATCFGTWQPNMLKKFFLGGNWIAPLPHPLVADMVRGKVIVNMNDFVGNILQSKFYACCLILLSGTRPKCRYAHISAVWLCYFSYYSCRNLAVVNCKVYRIILTIWTLQIIIALVMVVEYDCYCYNTIGKCL